MMHSKLLLLFFPLVMAFAAFSDLLTMRISNGLMLLLAAGFLGAALTTGIPLAEIGWNMACASLVLAVTFAFFAFGWIGGGDAKLAAATALWLGFGATLSYLVYAALLGGVLTLLLLLVRRLPLPLAVRSVGWIARLHDAGSGVPYGIALAAAGLLVYSDTAVFRALMN